MVDLPRNPPLVGPAPGPRRSVDDWQRSPVLLALSGGGTRAAALSYGVMEHLANTLYRRLDGAPRRLLDDVELISSVSGGSFTAAYYGLFQDRLFTEFRARFLEASIRGKLIQAVASPPNWPRLAAGNTNRLDLAAEVYDEAIFEDRTFSAMAARPSIVLNATNIGIGARFPFTERQFALIGSDLAAFPVSRAVAASSAFPAAFCPLTLKNHGAPPGHDWSLDEAVLRGDIHNNLDRYREAATALSYRDTTAHAYCHLLDGGLADNTGARHLIDLIRYGDGGSSIAERIERGSIDRLVVVIVNAKGSPDESIAASAATPGLFRVMVSTGTVAMDNYTDDSVALVESAVISLQRALMRTWQKRSGRPWGPADDPRPELAGDRILLPVPRALADPSLPKAVPVYVVHVTFAAVADPAARRELLAVPTDLSLPRSTVARIIEVARPLLEETPGWKALRAESCPAV